MTRDELNDIVAAITAVIEPRFDAMDRRFDEMDQRLAVLERRSERTDQTVNSINLRVDAIRTSITDLECEMLGFKTSTAALKNSVRDHQGTIDAMMTAIGELPAKLSAALVPVRTDILRSAEDHTANTMHQHVTAFHAGDRH
jgi:uncharacterized coiled-coil protein SlyX